MIGSIISETNPQKRLIGSVTAAVLAAQQGVDIVRVHDVLETHQGLKILNQLS